MFMLMCEMLCFPESPTTDGNTMKHSETPSSHPSARKRICNVWDGCCRTQGGRKLLRFQEAG